MCVLTLINLITYVYQKHSHKNFYIMIIIDLFDIDFHIFTVIKFLFNLVVTLRFKYDIYLNFTTKLNKNFITVKM